MGAGDVMNALQCAGIAAAIVALFTGVMAWVHPAGSEDRTVLGAFAAFLLLVACVFAGLGKQLGAIQ